MISYEEMVVDRSVDAAWLTFRVRLADHLAGMGDHDNVILRVDRGALRLPACIGLSTVHGESVRAEVLFETPDGPVQRRAPGLRKCGFERGTMTVARSEVDALCLALATLFRGPFAVIHPSFIEVDSDDLVLVDPPKQLVPPPAEGALPEVVTVHSQDELRAWVDRTLEPEFGHTPHKDDRGNIWVSRGEHRLVIHISWTRPIIDLTAVIAKDVDIRKARKLALKLNDSHYFFRFYVSGDRLMMATTVSGSPFVPEHLVHAMNLVLDHLTRRAPKTQAKLARTEPPLQEARTGIDPELMVVYGAGDRRAMVALAREMSTDDRTTLATWQAQAHAAEVAAKQMAAGRDHGPAQNALIDAVVAWHGVSDALIEALREQGASR